MYDARGGGTSSNGNAVFAIAVIGVIVAAFAAVFMWPTGQKAAAPIVAETSDTVEISEAFDSKPERAVATAIADIDPAAYRRIERRLTGGNLSTAERDQIILQEFSQIVVANSDVIENADVKHFDAILSDIQSGLKQATRADAKLCKGSTYAALENMKPHQVEAFMKREFMNNSDVREFGLKMTHRVLEAIADARENPVKHGAMEASDERAVQGLVMSLVTQPEIMMLAMSAQSGSGAEAALARTDVCQLSIAVLKAVDTLPDRTKGRLWAQAFSEVRKNGGFDFDPNGMSGLGGF